MNYEEKYKQALERAMKLVIDGHLDTITVDSIFSELKESEDERIRQGLIKAVSRIFEGHKLFDTDVTREEALAWLEKQGEQKPNPYSGTSFEHNGHIWGMCARDNGVDILLDKQLFKHLENQAEHKPYGQRKECEDCQFNYAGECKGYCDLKRKTDKVEPKFKVGYWVVNSTTLNLCHIVKVEHGQYICDDCSFPLTNENEYHLWTIQDAKDGDVLVDSYSKDSIIILYKGIYKERSILAHCGWNGYNFSVKTNGLGYGGLDNTNYLPATKEQRELLFQKMKESGYEWDAEKKVLSKRDMKILPEAKMQAYIKYCNDKSPSNILCDKCNKTVTIERQYPYFYDKDENDVYFASICPECGELLITKE